MLKKIVLTGAPCSGKSSVIELLRCQGYLVIPEVFQLLYAQAFAQNTADSFFADQCALRYRLMQTQRTLESQLSQGHIAFLDRGAWDIIFFGEWYGIAMPNELYHQAALQQYEVIFFMDPLPDQYYQKTQFRGESRVIAQQMHLFFLKRYQETGLKIIPVQFDTIENRVVSILNCLLL